MWRVLARYVLFGLAAAGLVGMGVSAADSGSSYGKQKVVYHINDIDSANGALRNIKNHIDAVGDENVDVIVVTHSKGGLTVVEGSKDSKGNSFGSTIQALANRGVKFQLCNNTIEGLKIDRNAINLNAEIVPSGVAQLAKLQQEGYTYIKP